MASHIVGGDLYYEDLGNNKYRIRLTVYRDCYNGVPDFDKPAYLGFFDSSNNLIPSSQLGGMDNALALRYRGKTKVDPTLKNKCFQVPANICYEVTTYDTTITLPPRAGGYQMAYQRCCRNGTIQNIQNPSGTGATYYARIPDKSNYATDSNPVFVNNAPNFTCVNVPFEFDMSATDKEGDSLVYSLCDPYTGAETGSSQPNPPSNPPYTSVTWKAPYSPANEWGGTPLTIDPKTGKMTAYPTVKGQFVTGVCVDEYRNGKLVGTTKRDFQINITDCPSLLISSIQSPQTQCGSKTVTFSNSSVGAGRYHWDFGVPSLSNDTSNQTSPSYAYPDTGHYVVTLIAYSKDNPGCSDTSKSDVYIYEKLNANFTYTQSPCTKQVAFFDSTNQIRNFTNTYSWDFGDATTSSSKNPTHTYSSAGIYVVKLIVTSSNGCVDSIKKNINVNLTIPVNAGNDVSACQGKTVQLGAASVTGYSYSWSPTTGLDNPAISNPKATVTGNITYIVTATKGECTGKDTVVVSLMPPPTADAGPNKSICTGQSVVIGNTTQANTSYTWSPASSLNNANIANPTASPTVTTTYSLTVTNTVTGCVSTTPGQMVVTVNPLPPAGAAGADKSICLNNPVQIGTPTNGNYNYTWSPASGLSDPTIGNPTANPTVNTTYIVTLTNKTTGCSIKDTVVVSINPNPPADAGGNKTICTESSVNIGPSTSNTSSYTYTWGPSNGLSSTSVPNPTANPTTTTTYTLTVTDKTTGCVSTSSAIITVNPLPTTSVTNKVTCNGSPVNIGTANNASYTYLWTPATGLNNATISNPLASPSVTTTYNLKVTDSGSGCSQNYSVVLTINPSPNATAGGDVTICNTKSTVIGGPTNNNYSYSWSPSSGLSSTTVSNPTANPSNTTTYYLTVTDKVTGCIKLDTVEVTVNALPGFNLRDTIICIGQSIVIGPTNNNGYSYSWSPNTALNNSNIANPTCNTTVTTTYSLVVTDNTSSCSASKSMMVTVNPLPTASAGSDKTICENHPIQIGATGNAANSYNWNPTSGLSDASISNPTANPSVSTTYILTVTNKTTGCSKQDTVVVNVNGNPMAQAGPNKDICFGESVEIGDASASSTFTYAWNPTNSLSNSTIPNPIASPTATTVYQVVVTNPTTGCTTSANVTIKVNPLPQIALNNATICYTNSTQIGVTNDPAYSYKWTPNVGLSSDIVSDPIANPTVTTTYTLRVTNNSTSCSKDYSLTVTVNPRPVATAGSDQVICKNSGVVIGGANNSNYTYQWNPVIGLSSATVSNPTASPTVSTTYNLTVTDKLTSCTTIDTVIVAVNDLPNFTLRDTSMCKKGAVIIGPLNNPSYSYSWSPAVGLSNTNTANPTCTVANTTTYTLVVTDNATGCTLAKSMIFTVKPLPTAMAGADQTICEGSNISIGMANEPNNTYQWNPTTGLSSSTVSSPIASPTVTTTYDVLVTDKTTGCINRDTIIVTVNPAPYTNAGPDRLICEGEKTQLGVVGNAAYSYSWTPATTLNDPTSPQPIAIPSVSTTYYLTVTDKLTNCNKKDTIVVSVNPAPTAIVNDTKVCFGDSIKIGPVAESQYSYAWNHGKTLSDSLIARPIASPTVTTSYMLTITNVVTNCQKSFRVIVTVNPLPTPDAGPDITICEGSTGQIGAVANANYNYTWKPTSTLNNPNISNPVANPTITTTYVVTAIDKITSCLNQDSVVVHVNPKPVVNVSDVIVCKGYGAQIGDVPNSDYSYQWSPAKDLSSTTIANPITTTSVDVLYSLVVTNVNTGCKTNKSVTVTVNDLPTVFAGNDVTICQKTSTQLGGPANSAFNYAWSPASTLNNASISNPIASPTITTTYVVTVTDKKSLCYNTDTVIVKVILAPKAIAGFDSTYCLGNGPKQLGAAPVSGYSYTWTPTTNLNNPNIANPKANPSATTTYVVMVFDPVTKCSNSDTAIVFINPLPDVDLGANQNVCKDNLITIGPKTSSNSNTYTWTPAQGLSDPTVSNPTVTITADATYTLYAEDKITKCFKADTLQIKKIDHPVYVLGPDVTICYGTTTTIGGNTLPNTSYTWTPTAGLTNPNAASTNASPSVTTTYVATAKDQTYGCETKDDIIVTVVKPSVNAGSDKIICRNNPVQIGSVNDTSYTYLWSPVAGLSSTTISNPLANPTSTTTYIIKATTKGSNCSVFDTVVVNVNQLPTTGLSPSYTVCLRNGALIGLNNNNAYNYSWSPAAGLDNPTSSNPEAKPIVTTTYKLIITDKTTGCTSTDTTVVHVNPLPPTNAGLDKSLCIGDSISIGTNAIAGNTYRWTPGKSLKDSTVALTKCGAKVTTTYVLTVVNNSTTCTQKDTVEVKVNPLPTYLSTKQQLVCKSGSIILGSQADTALNYRWVPSTYLNDTTIANPNASNVTNTIKYNITASFKQTGCQVKDTLRLEVVNYPQIEAGPNRTICKQASITLGANPQNNAYIYSWTPAKTLNDSTKAQPIATPTAANTSYILTALDKAHGMCPSKDTVVIKILPLQAVAGTDQMICRYSSVKIGTAPTPGQVYSWSPTAGLSNANVSNPDASPANTTTYILTARDTAVGCISMDTVVIRVNKVLLSGAGLDTAVCLGNSVKLGLKTNNSGYTYLWTPAKYLNSNTSPNPICTPKNNTTYIVTIADTTIKCSITDTVNVTVNKISVSKLNRIIDACPGDSLSLGNGYNDTKLNYSWSPNYALNNAFSMNPKTGTKKDTIYSVIINDRNGCVSRDTVKVKIVNIMSSVLPNYKACMGNGVVLNPSPDTSYQYLWTPAKGLSNPNAASPKASPTSSTTYNVKIYRVTIYGDTCSINQNVSIDVSNSKLMVQASNDSTICRNSETTLKAHSNSANTTYKWYYATLNSLPISSTEKDSIIKVTPPSPISRYFVTANNQYCDALDSVILRLDSVSVSAQGIEVCKNEIGVVKANKHTGKNLQYTWSPTTYVEGPSNTISLTVRPQETIIYSLVSTDSMGCSSKTDVPVRIHSLETTNIIADKYSILQGDTVTLQVDPIRPNYSYEWSPKDYLTNPYSPITISRPRKTMKYFVQIKEQSNFGCTATDSVVITVIHKDVCGEPDIFVANAFTPNGDGNNDMVFVRGEHVIKSFYFTIFDRWGEKIFESSDFRNGWDGTYHNELLNPDVYVYYLRVTCKNNFPYFKKGNITLIR